MNNGVGLCDLNMYVCEYVNMYVCEVAPYCFNMQRAGGCS